MNFTEISKKLESKNNKFLKQTGEKEKLNQYWFSEKTIEFIVAQVIKYGKKVAFISTPSIFFTCPAEVQNESFLFDFDENFLKKHKNVIKFDYNSYDDIKEFDNCFDFLLIDPPFINEEAWTKYSLFAKKIMKENSKILTCSIAENKELLSKLLDLKIREYQPSIPHLVYQYNFYSNYEDEELNKKNEEILD